MSNLLPTDARKMVVIEYWLRATAVFLLLVAAGGVSVMALYLPVWVLISDKIDVLKATYPEAIEQSLSLKTIEESVAAANQLATHMSRGIPDTSLLELFRLVEGYTTPAVVLTSFTTARGEDGLVPTITINGNAATREALAGFADALKREARFSAVELPISSLTRGTDLDFTITITLAAPAGT